MDTNILLESGTNELEILEFVVHILLWREHLVRAERQLLLSIWRSVWE